MILELAAAAVVVAMLFLWFLWLEHSDRAILVVGSLLVILVIEASLYPGFEVPPGIFHPSIGGLSFRPYELVIAVALFARVVVRGAPQRFSTSTLCWLALALWVFTQAFVGLYAGHALELVAFEVKAVLYLGAMALAAGVPAEAYIRGKAMDCVIIFSSVVATIMMTFDIGALRWSGGLPGIPLDGFGRLGSDAASVFLALGVLALGLGMARGQRRFGMVLAATPLLMSTFIPSQRAVLISFTALVVLVAIAFASRTTWNRIHPAPAELLLGALVVVASLVLPAISAAWKGTEPPSLVLAARVSESFTSPAKRQSAEDRINQYRVAWPLIAERPVFGWGLGKTFAHFQPGPNDFVVNNLTHNIAGDLLLRTGVVGLVLFTLAVAGYLRDGLRVWRRQPDNATACVALAAVVVIVGILGKGMVESIFEKFRLAVLLGVFLGMLRSLPVTPPADGSAPLSTKVTP